MTSSNFNFTLALAEPDAIRAAAHDYNADFPEATAEIDAGEPMVLVCAGYYDRYGRKVRLVLDVGIRTEDGGWIGSDRPQAAIVNHSDGRTSPVNTAKKFLAARLAATKVPVVYRRF